MCVRGIAPHPFDHRARLTAWIFFVGCVNAFFSPYLSMALSPIGGFLHLGEAGMGRALAASSIGTIGAALVAGALTDRWGPKRVLVAGMWVCCLAYAICGVASHYLVLFLGLFILGCAGGLAWPAGLSLLSHMHPGQRRRIFSMLLVSGAVAGILSPWVFGLLLPHLSGPWILTPFLCFGLSYAGLAWRLSREAFPRPARSGQGAMRGTLRLLKSPFLLMACGMVLLHVGSDTGLYGWICTFLDRSFPKPHPFQPGVALSVYSLAYAASRGLVAFLPNRLPNLPIILLSSALGGTFTFLSIHSEHYAMAMMLYGLAAFCFSWEYVALLAMVGDRFPQNAGAVYGLLNAVGPVGATIVPALMGQMAEGSDNLRWAMSVPSVGFWMLSLLAVAWLVYDRRVLGPRGKGADKGMPGDHTGDAS